jgi:hypothetical protein
MNKIDIGLTIFSTVCICGIIAMQGLFSNITSAVGVLAIIVHSMLIAGIIVKSEDMK